MPQKIEFKWRNLDYWTTGEWQVVQERLRDITRKKLLYCPGRSHLFAALDRTPFDTVKVMIIGQDPYPTLGHATGVAFEVPDDLPREKWPPTLKNVMAEYHNDLGYPAPRSGNLQKWTEQGVLLWNAYPSCDPGRPGSHNWVEWTYLTKEIIQRLAEKGVVFVFLGNKARDFAQWATDPQSEVLLTSHPSPRGNLNSSNPFLGSRIFSTINDKLVHCWEGGKSINWRL